MAGLPFFDELCEHSHVYRGWKRLLRVGLTCYTEPANFLGLAPTRIEVNRLLKKWAFLSVSAALVVIGCGGSGGSGSGNHGSTNTSGGIPGTNVQINIATADQNGNTYGIADFLYLTGQARDPGDLAAVVKRITVEDQYGQASNNGAPETKLPLKLYTSSIVNVDVPFTTQNSRLFESFTLDFLRFEAEGSTSSATPTKLYPPVPTTDPTTGVANNLFKSRIRLFPGRHTSIPIFLDDSMFADNGVAVADTSNVLGDNVGSTVVSHDGTTFNADIFRFRNLDSNSRLTSFLSDYVGFDISAMATTSRPVLTDGSVAGRFYISGDAYAISVAGTRGRFEVLTTDSTQPLVGNFGPQNSGTNSTAPGTYDLTQLDPTDLDQKAKITSLQGIWRDYQSVMSGFGTFEVIAFPNVQDNNEAEIVMVARNGSTITNLYYGVLDYSVGKFQAWPIKNIVSAAVTNEIDGTISGLKTSAGSITNVPDAIRYGNYTVTSGTLPTGFQNTGTFVVFRK